MQPRSLNRMVPLIVLIAASLPVRAEPQKARSQPPAVDMEELVWPGPPEKARVRFVAAIGGAEDVTGKVKLSFFERLAGRPQAADPFKLQRPYGVAVDGSGRIHVADSAQRAVVIFDRAKRQVARWRGSAQFPLVLPIGVAIDGDGRLFVSDSFASQIVVFQGGKPIAGFGKAHLGRPGGMVIDPVRGRLYVADAKLNQVLVFKTTDYTLERTVGTLQPPDDFPPGTFSGPTNVALDAQGWLYVTDTLNCRVQVFDTDGRFVRAFGNQGTQPGSFIRPKGIAVDSQGHIYVADAAFNNFQIFSPEGGVLLFVGAGGDKPGEFLLPAGMTIDRQDRIYVTEQRMAGGRLQIFQYVSDRDQDEGR